MKARAALVVAAVDGYFLIFAQFSFVELLRAGGTGVTQEKIALGAMAGFTTSFCALLAVLLTGRPLGGNWTVGIWHLALLVMLCTLAMMGWHEGVEPSWMLMKPAWRELGLTIRTGCGAAMLAVSAAWLMNWRTR